MNTLLKIRVEESEEIDNNPETKDGAEEEEEEEEEVTEDQDQKKSLKKLLNNKPKYQLQLLEESCLPYDYLIHLFGYKINILILVFVNL